MDGNHTRKTVTLVIHEIMDSNPASLYKFAGFYIFMVNENIKYPSYAGAKRVSQSVTASELKNLLCLV
jgi:hypothetical protein